MGYDCSKRSQGWRSRYEVDPLDALVFGTLGGVYGLVSHGWFGRWVMLPWSAAFVASAVLMKLRTNRWRREDEERDRAKWLAIRRPGGGVVEFDPAPKDMDYTSTPAALAAEAEPSPEPAGPLRSAGRVGNSPPACRPQFDPADVFGLQE